MAFLPASPVVSQVIIEARRIVQPVPEKKLTVAKGRFLAGSYAELWSWRRDGGRSLQQVFAPVAFFRYLFALV